MQFASNILVLHDLNLQLVQVFHHKKELNSFIENHKKTGENVGMVPTMGALHEGHLSLISLAQKSCALVVVSIFVNPTQFNNPEDLEKYPRTLKDDLALLKKSFDNCIIFAPEVQEIYNDSITSEHFEFGEIASKMEGKYRAGHFDGVGTILKRLFEFVKPDKAFFGLKDYQQYLIVKKLVEITQQNVEIIGCPINREASGLARSSRNKQLSEEAQTQASLIYKILQEVKSEFGTKSVADIKKGVKNEFEKNPILKLEYFEISDADDLEPISNKNTQNKSRAFIAAYANNVRLIDNIALNY